jgi:transmembrane sensor
MADLPWRRHLQHGLDEARIKEMWERVDHAPVRSRRPWLLAMATAVVALLLVLGASRFSRAPEPRQLALQSGNLPQVLGSDGAAIAPRFDDGSRLSLASGTRLEVLRNDGRSFVTVLRRGEATFDVKPGGPRHWVVEAGELSVEVVGTRFRVERAPAATRVSVDHGVVVVRGERVPGGGARLTAGMSFELVAKTNEPQAIVNQTENETEPSRLPLAPASASEKPTASAPAAEIEPGRAGVASATPSAAPASSDEVALALRAADVAREGGDTARAIRQFSVAFERAPAGDRRRGLAALSLARLLMNADPARAARILRSSLTDMPQALLEDAMVRLVEADSRAGNREAATRSALDYQRRFPAGRRTDEVRRWSEP